MKKINKFIAFDYKNDIINRKNIKNEEFYDATMA